MGQNPADEIYFRHFLATIETLPTLPAIALEGMKRALKPESSTRDLAEIIELDPPLTAKVLKAANNTNYGRSGVVSSLHDAFTLLGFPLLRSIVLSVSAIEVFSDRREDCGLAL